MSEEERLEDGWGRATPIDDTLMRAYTIGFAEWVGAIGRANGTPVLDDDDVTALDSGSGFFLANAAVLRRPQDADGARDTMARLVDFYAAGSGGPWVVMSPWPTPDVRDLGLQLVGHPPFMVRPAGGIAPPDPTGLRIEEVHDDETLRDFETALVAGYPAPGGEGFFTPQVRELEGTRLWVGYLDGEPVATAAAETAGGVNHVEWIANRPEARGRGVGAALTWRATLADASRPAALIASDPGQPVYERMGYLRVARFTIWMGLR